MPQASRRWSVVSIIRRCLASDIQAVQHSGEHGDLVGLDAHLHLAQRRSMSMVEGGEQVTAVLMAMAGAA
jgi:hypothetical protein